MNIDKEMEGFKEIEIDLIIALLDNSIAQTIKAKELANRITLEDLKGKLDETGDPLVAYIVKNLEKSNPDGLQTQATNAITMYIDLLDIEMKEKMEVITKLHLLKSRI